MQKQHKILFYIAEKRLACKTFDGIDVIIPVNTFFRENKNFENIFESGYPSSGISIHLNVIQQHPEIFKPIYNPITESE